MTILASRNVGLLHYLAGSPLQDRQDVLLMEATLEPGWQCSSPQVDPADGLLPVQSLLMWSQALHIATE